MAVREKQMRRASEGCTGIVLGQCRDKTEKNKKNLDTTAMKKIDHAPVFY